MKRTPLVLAIAALIAVTPAAWAAEPPLPSATGSQCGPDGNRRPADAGPQACAESDTGLVAIVMLSQANGDQGLAEGEDSTAVGHGSWASGHESSAYGAYSWADADHATALGAGSSAFATGATAVGVGAYASGISATAGGYGSSADGDYSTAYGTGSQASGRSSTAIGGQMIVEDGLTGEREWWSTVATGQESTALGVAARATRYGATAVGAMAEASGEQSLAVGQGANARGHWSVAVGGGAYTFDNSSVAVGDGAMTFGIRGVAIGNSAQAHGTLAHAFGQNAYVSGDDATAVGGWSTVLADNSVALGAHSIADRESTVSVGAAGAERQIVNVAAGTERTDAVNLAQLREATADSRYFAATGDEENSQEALADGDFTTAAGSGAYAGAPGATALGSGAFALGEYATASGFNSVASGQWSTSYGAGSQASGDSAVAIGGQMAIINGDTWEEEIWSTEASGQESTAIGIAARATDYGSTALGVFAQAEGRSSLALGQTSYAADDHAVAVGARARAFGEYSMAVGARARAIGPRSSAFGVGAQAHGEGSLALGGHAATGGSHSIAMGWNSIVWPESDGSMALGRDSAVADGASNSVALGSGSYTDRANVVSVGTPARTHQGAVPFLTEIEALDRQIVNVAAGTEGTDAVNLDQLTIVADRIGEVAGNAIGYDDDSRTSVTFAGEQGTVLANVAAGAINASSTEAVNGAQVHAALDSVATAFGGGTVVDASGRLIGTVYSVQGSYYGNVGDALGALDGALSGLDSRVGQLEHGGTSDIRTAGTGGVPAAGSDRIAADASNAVAAGGSADNQSRVTNVADGVNDHDAANVAQVEAGDARTLNEAKSYTDERFSVWEDNFTSLRGEIDERFRHQDRRIDRMGAMSGAYAGMALNTAGLAGQNRVGVGVGAQGGEQAIAIGYQRAIGNRASVSFGGALSGGESSASAGAGFSW